MARRHGWEAVPLVGPGSELQLTLDGGAVPHVEVVAAREDQRPESRVMRTGAPRPSRLNIVTQSEPSGAAATERRRP